MSSGIFDFVEWDFRMLRNFRFELSKMLIFSTQLVGYYDHAVWDKFLVIPGVAKHEVLEK